MRLRHPHPFTERSLEVRHSAWARDNASANLAVPTIFQVRGPVSGAPAREAGEVGASPTHLTNRLLVEMKKSTERSGEGAAAGRGRRPERSEPISPLSKGSQSVRVRSRAPVSRCRLAARAAGLHPAITGVRVPPPRPLSFLGSSTSRTPHC